LHGTVCREVGCAEQYADAPALLVISNSVNVVKFNKGSGRLSTLWRVQQDGDVDLDYNCIQVDNSYGGPIPEPPSEDSPIVTDPIKKPSDGSTTGGKCLTDSNTGKRYCEDPSQCCSQYMYCGPSSDPDYCGNGCLGGPCWGTGANPPSEDRDDTTGNSFDEEAGEDGSSGVSKYRTYNCDDRNPCTAANIRSGKTYFPAREPEYFVQCGGSPEQCYIQACGPGTVWEQSLLTCIGAGQNFWTDILCKAMNMPSLCN